MVPFTWDVTQRSDGTGFQMVGIKHVFLFSVLKVSPSGSNKSLSLLHFKTKVVPNRDDRHNRGWCPFQHVVTNMSKATSIVWWRLHNSKIYENTQTESSMQQFVSHTCDLHNACMLTNPWSMKSNNCIYGPISWSCPASHHLWQCPRLVILRMSRTLVTSWCCVNFLKTSHDSNPDRWWVSHTTKDTTPSHILWYICHYWLAWIPG